MSQQVQVIVKATLPETAAFHIGKRLPEVKSFSHYRTKTGIDQWIFILTMRDDADNVGLTARLGAWYIEHGTAPSLDGFPEGTLLYYQWLPVAPAVTEQKLRVVIAIDKDALMAYEPDDDPTDVINAVIGPFVQDGNDPQDVAVLEDEAMSSFKENNPQVTWLFLSTPVERPII